ncbi:MAG: GLEYA domain-containing protein, partial [Opitutales bacterium]
YLAHKWLMSGKLPSTHTYKSATPDFGDPTNGVDVTLYWGSIDGGTDTSLWEHEVSAGNYYSEAVIAGNGFEGRGFNRESFGNNQGNWNGYFGNDIEALRNLAPAGVNLKILGEPNDPAATGFRFNGDADFKNAGLGIDRNDRYMDIFLADFNAPNTGNYKFKMANKDDRVTMWIDLDQDDLFETGGANGNERLGGNSNFTSGNVALTAGQTYLFAMSHGEWGGGSGFNPQFQTPLMGMQVIKPLAGTQNGIFTVDGMGLSNGQPLSAQIDLQSDITGLLTGSTYYYRVHGGNSLGEDWSDVTGSFVAEKKIDFNTGTLTFNSDGPTPAWSHSDGTSGSGDLVSTSYVDGQGNTLNYDVAKYTFDYVNIGDGVTVSLIGVNPIDIRATGDVTILTALDLDGIEGTDAGNTDLIGTLGGGYGGHESDGSGWGNGGSAANLTVGSLVGGGRSFVGWIDPRPVGITSGREASGGGYGGLGARAEAVGGQGQHHVIPPGGQTYGDLDVTHLLGGSGGGGGNERSGGTGGGAIKIISDGTLTLGGNISTIGGKGGARSNEAQRSGGSGSGGAIYLKGDNVVINAGVTISANGGAGATGITNGNSNSNDGGGAGASGGGGGRVFMEAVSSLINHESGSNANVTATGGQSAGVRHGSDGTVKILRPQVTELVFTSGGLTIDTDFASITHTDGSFLAGEFSDHTYTDSDGTDYTYKICTFTADQINLSSA